MTGQNMLVDEFEANYTLLVVRVVDQENCAYMPNREAIQKSGPNLDLLVPITVRSQ